MPGEGSNTLARASLSPMKIPFYLIEVQDFTLGSSFQALQGAASALLRKFNVFICLKNIQGFALKI